MPTQRFDEEFNISFVGLIRKFFGCQIQYFMGFIKAILHILQKLDPVHNTRCVRKVAVHL